MHISQLSKKNKEMLLLFYKINSILLILLPIFCKLFFHSAVPQPVEGAVEDKPQTSQPNYVISYS